MSDMNQISHPQYGIYTHSAKVSYLMLSNLY